MFRLLLQIVVCQNVARKENVVQGILVHELIHMFDFCTKKVCRFCSVFYHGKY